jgi:catechol 2,3-dioxygenase-like lactoylglutathione lyase family enzyme
MEVGGWESITPQLPVADVPGTLAWYRDVLGCRIAWVWNDGGYGAVYSGATELFFARVEGPPAEACCYIRVPDAEAVHTRCLEQGVEIIEPLGSRPWGMREFAIRDPNGHRLRFGHGEKTIAEIPQFHV